MGFNFPLPKWKDENPITYQKQQIKTRLTKLIRRSVIDPKNVEVAAEISKLQEQYNTLVKDDQNARPKTISYYGI